MAERTVTFTNRLEQTVTEPVIEITLICEGWESEFVKPVVLDLARMSFDRFAYTDYHLRACTTMTDLAHFSHLLDLHCIEHEIYL